MVTLARTSTVRHTTIRIETEHPTQFIDLTDELEAFVKDTGSIPVWSTFKGSTRRRPSSSTSTIRCC
jgi:hypothetical protein